MQNKIYDFNKTRFDFNLDMEKEEHKKLVVLAKSGRFPSIKRIRFDRTAFIKNNLSVLKVLKYMRVVCYCKIKRDGFSKYLF